MFDVMAFIVLKLKLIIKLVVFVKGKRKMIVLVEERIRFVVI